MALLVFIFYALNGSAAARQALVTQVLENSKSIHQMVQARAITCPQ